jgi:predicted oxidoreductase
VTPSAPGAGADVVVVGAGLAGLVAAGAALDRGRRVVLVDQEPRASLGGQAFWSLGGVFLVGTPEQRRLGVRDGLELAVTDWLGSAGFDRGADDPAGADYWAKRWALAYVDFAAGEQRRWLRNLGIGFFPVVGWAERGGQLAGGHGNSVPRFHIVWGTGPGLLSPFVDRLEDAAVAGRLELLCRHRVDELVLESGAVTGVRGAVLEPSAAPRGRVSSRRVVRSFELQAAAVVLTSGGIGGDHGLVRAAWPDRLGPAPAQLLTGVPAHVDGRLLAVAERSGGRIVNRDRMWHYTEGVANWNPIWPGHGLRILSGPSPLWLDASGRRLPPPNFPGFDTLETLRTLCASGQPHSWLVLNRRIAEKELALSGSEQNPDLTGRDLRAVLSRARPGLPPPVQALLERGPDSVSAGTAAELAAAMNSLTGSDLVEAGRLESEIAGRDRQLANAFGKDGQLAAIRNARRYLGDRLVRVTPPHRILDPAAGPLYAIRLRVLTRKTLGGIQTDLAGRVVRPDGSSLPGLYAAGEAAGFGGGGMHGYRSLEGTFLGGCLFSGRVAGRSAALDAR